MFFDIFWGIIIPFIGTFLGSACVYFVKKEQAGKFEKIFLGFAGGVMFAASVWSLLIPAMNYSEGLGKFAFFPALAGFWAGALFIYLTDTFVPSVENTNSVGMFFWAVLLHNIPEGMAVGVVYAGILAGEGGVSIAGAMLLSIGIAIQNFPEGAIISLPCALSGKNKNRAFILGALSGIVEPLGAVAALFAVTYVLPALPYVLGFAAGAMIYVVLCEIMPKLMKKDGFHKGNIAFSVGFTVMMMLDVMLS